MYVTEKLRVWSEYTVPTSTTVGNTRCVSAFLISLLIGTFVDLSFFLFG